MEEKKSIFEDKNVLVVGLARSGVGASNLLAALGAKVTVTDSKPREALQEQIGELDQPVKVIAGGNPVNLFGASDMIVVSPGVPLDIPPIQFARAKGIPVIGELELAYQVIHAGGEDKTETEFIGITGTNGKSTVTTLVDLMLRNSGARTLLGGNIGNALSGEILETLLRSRGAGPPPGQAGAREEKTVDYVVAEISSFQLESIERFRPRIAAILNITPDHLNRYAGMEDYIDAKARIFENQLPEDFLVLNADDPAVMKMAQQRLSARNENAPNTFFFSRKKEVKGVYFRDGSLYCNIPKLPFPSSKFPFISLEEITIQGVHNLENAMAASLMTLLSGQPYQPVRDALKTFPGLEHRLEAVCEINGIRFVNDSKATNVGAVEKSLEGLDHLILIMGGLDKGSDFSVLRGLVKERVKCLIVIGEARQKIERALQGTTDIRVARDLREAVSLSVGEASAGDTVLLSPGCASFDMFRDFEERGRRFKEIVREINVH